MNKLKMTFIGCGSAFTVGSGNYHSNVLLEANGKRLLLDCGTDARLSLYDAGYSYKDMDAVYISHLHADHAGGLEWLGISTVFDPNCAKPTLYISNLLVDDLWQRVLSGGMRTMQGQLANLHTYFEVNAIQPNGQFIWQDIPFTLVQTVHVMHGFQLMPCYGVLFSVNGKQIFFTADTQFCPDQLNQYYESADIIFHDCETSAYKSKVHAHFDELCQLPPAIKAKMWLYHYSPGALPDAKSAGFLGFVVRKQVFEF